MKISRENVLNEGRRAGNALAQSLLDKPATQAVETNVASLRSLSAIIDGLTDEAHQCGGRDCMGRAIDGERLWVTLDRLHSETERAERAEARAAAAEEALQAVIAATHSNTDRLGLATDWHAVTLSVDTIARRALGASSRRAA